jgi:hypothetical protein
VRIGDLKSYERDHGRSQRSSCALTKGTVTNAHEDFNPSNPEAAKERKNAAVWVIEYSQLIRETWGGLPLNDGECFQWGLPSDRRGPTSLVKATKTLREWIERNPPWPEMGWPDYRYRLRHIHTNEVVTFDQAEAIIALRLPLVPEVLEPFFAVNREALNTSANAETSVSAAG